MSKNKMKEFGDYQTPIELATEILNYLKGSMEIPKTILEPTCGLGSFIKSARKVFPNATILGFDINKEYLNTLRSDLISEKDNDNIRLNVQNFFEANWADYFKNFNPPILVIGNPPWITSSEMSVIKGDNLPEKSNTKNLAGIEAMTGKSNFDISEWMIMNLSRALNNFKGALAMLCKVSVARKVFSYLIKENSNLNSCKIFLIDAKKYFDANVDACLLFVKFNDSQMNNMTCKVFNGFNDEMMQEIGFDSDILIANVKYHEKWKHLEGKSDYTWRSGIKHDASKVMELIKVGDKYYNCNGDEVQIESTYLYPMLKSSDLVNGNVEQTEKWMIVPQKKIGEETSIIKTVAPLTWNYLKKHSEKLNKRKSSIYKGKPRFSIFGVGDYTFRPWKIALSGFYKTINFHLISPIQGKPVVFDDTCYFLSIDQQQEAVFLSTLLKKDCVKEFFQSFIFWDSKRPITKMILKKLSIEKLIADHEKFS